MGAIFGYARVSTVEQTAANQRLEIKQAGFAIDDDCWFQDVGVSGATQALQRPQFGNLMRPHVMRKGDTLVVTKIDRLGRDAIDVQQTIRTLTDRGVSVYVTNLGKTDLTSPAGKVMLAMLAAFAEMERDLLIERTQAGLARAKAEGKQLGRPSKTTPEQQREIRKRLSAGDTVSEMSRVYGISRASVIAIRDAQ